MIVLSTFCSTFPRVTRGVAAARFGAPDFDFLVTEGRRAFFVEGRVVVVGASWSGAGGSIA
jgi:hypothetical protein